MDYRIKPFGALILVGFALTICIPSISNAQEISMSDIDNLSFVNYEYLENDEKNAFDLTFESKKYRLLGQVESSVQGYDSLHLLSIEVIDLDETFMKIQGYLFDKHAQSKLFWTKGFNFSIHPLDITLVSGSYIQFAAYNKLKNAERGLAFFDAFDLDIVFIDNMYKLVLPYERATFSLAKEKYKDYDIWRVEYTQAQVIEVAKPGIIAKSEGADKKVNMSASL